jgi:L-fuculose-phosphate aldolase
MENHGIVCGARDIEEAEWFAENADAYCQVLLLASGHGAKLQQVGPKSVKDFLAIRESLGLPVEKSQKLYNTDRFNGYKMKRTAK